jgi:hypothetical protein
LRVFTKNSRCAYKDNKEIYIAIRDCGEKGKQNDLKQKLLLFSTRAKEETEKLNDLSAKLDIEIHSFESLSCY